MPYTNPRPVSHRSDRYVEQCRALGKAPYVPEDHPAFEALQAPATASVWGLPLIFFKHIGCHCLH